MPEYEYFCRRCKEPFVRTMHIEEHEKQIPPCPKCELKDRVEKRMSSFTAVTSRKSAGY